MHSFMIPTIHHPHNTSSPPYIIPTIHHPHDASSPPYITPPPHHASSPPYITPPYITHIIHTPHHTPSPPYIIPTKHHTHHTYSLSCIIPSHTPSFSTVPVNVHNEAWSGISREHPQWESDVWDLFSDILHQNRFLSPQDEDMLLRDSNYVVIHLLHNYYDIYAYYTVGSRKLIVNWIYLYNVRLCGWYGILFNVITNCHVVLDT